jgi:hypothetical protein
MRSSSRVTRNRRSSIAGTAVTKAVSARNAPLTYESVGRFV